MKKITSLTLMLAIMGLYAYGMEPAAIAQVETDTTNVDPVLPPSEPDSTYHYEYDDTIQIVDFTLVEQDITLKVGESHQLQVDPADAKVNWHESWGLAYNPVTTVDENGVVTALKAGKSVIVVESSGGAIIKYCNVTVVDEGGIRKDKKTFYPTDECVWTDVKFSLDNDGNFKADGAFYGSGAQTNYLNYIVTEQCIFMWFEINYEDSTKMFYPQPFTLEIDGCNAQEYNVYLNNRTQTVEAQDSFVRYALRRGSSINGTTNAESIIFRKDEDLIYNLKGQVMESVPTKGFYIQNGHKKYSY